MGKINWCLIVLTLIPLCIGTDENVRKKRQILPDQPRIITENGHLIFQSGVNHNITFRSGSGGILVDNLDLKKAVSQVHTNKDAIVRLQDTLVQNSGNVSSRVASLENQLTSFSSVVQDVHDLFSAVSNVRTRAEETNSLSSSRLTHIEAQMANVNGMSDIPTEISNLRANVHTLENLVHALEETVRSLKTLLTTNECLSNPCLNGGTCVDMYNGYLCRCPPNWQGQQCTEDVNECADYAGTDMGCQNGATCINSLGSFSCQCTTNWYGIHCSELHNNCTGASHAELCGHGTCVDADRIVSGQPRYRCICETGWTTSSTGPACTVDVDECATGTHCSVDPPVQCINIPGSFVCGSCPLGYTGNGHACYDINECAIDNGGCSTSPRVECINTRGSRACGSCPGGYQGNGVSCTYVGLCSQNNGGCHHLATCSETSGLGVTCSCTDGYFGSGFGSSGCQEQSHAAACSSNPCQNGAVCTPAGSTGFSCSCGPGFSGPTCSTVVNACLSNPCQNGGTCVSQTQAPGYSCECTADYTGPDCQEAQQECGDRLSGEAGSFRYPRTAGVFNPHEFDCYWTISTSTDKVLTVTFPVFNLNEDEDCDFDFLQIHDGSSLSSDLIGRFCSSHRPNGSISSSRSQLYFWFSSGGFDASQGFEVHWTSHPRICGSHLNVSDHGTIKSPGYPGNYPNNRDCVWTVVVSPGSNILFTFADLALMEHPTCDDYLEVRDGELDTSPLIQRYCNSQTHTPIQTTGPYAYIRFHSDHSLSDRGFHLLYTALTVGRQGCGAALSGPEGEVLSPGYPNPYTHDLTCVWVITVARGSFVQLSFMDFSLETSSSCSQDYLTIKDGSDQMAPTLGRFCGTDQPAVTTSSSNIISLELHTDEHNSGRGFQAHWTTACGGTFSALHGQIQSPNWPGHYPLTKTCNYLIEVPDSHTVSFHLTDNGLGEGLNCTYNYIEFHDGATQAATVIDSRLCGGVLASRIMSTGSNLLVRFSTDGSVNNHGFRGTFTAVQMGPEGCGGVYNNNTGIISSPGHPNAYPNGVNCTWYINVRPGLIIRLIFHTFSLEDPDGDTCDLDFVDIYDNSTMFEGSRLGRYCGSDLPAMVTSTENALVVNMQTDNSLAMEGFTASYLAMTMSTVCGSALTSASGVITSPNYPNPLPYSRRCVWTISVADNNQIFVNITDMDFSSFEECHLELLEIRNGGYSTSPLLHRFCHGKDTPQTILSHGHLLYLRYQTAFDNHSRGFRLEYTSAAAVCGGDFTTPTGVIMSPNYPNDYAHTGQCYWSITVSKGSSIILFFEVFDLRHFRNCLKVQEGDSSGASLGVFCGSTLPPPVMSTSNQLWLTYQSYGSTYSNGFKLNYHIDCNRRLTGISGVIESINFPNPYPSHTNCTWIIEVPVGNKINVSFAAFRLEQGHRIFCWDYLLILDGGDLNSRRLAYLCGNNFPDPIQSTGNLLRLNFYANEIFNHDGFRLEWVVDGCGGHLFGSSGTIISPNYPNRPTQSSIECHWAITVDTGKAIELTVSTFDLDNYSGCQSVFLKIIAGSDSTGPQLTQLCHKLTQPEILHTTGTTAFIQFKYFNTAIGTGFKLNYRAVSGGCGGNFTARTATITSFKYPRNYEQNTECEWNITVAPGHVVSLTFPSFHVGSSICYHGFVRLYDGPSKNAALIAHLCGWIQGIRTYNSSGNHMFIWMQTSERTNQGFSATYTTGCGGTLNADTDGQIFSPNYPDRYPWNTQCVWIISSSYHDRRVSLTFTHMDMASGDGCTTEFVSVNYGLVPPLNQTGTPQNHYCGTSIPATIISEDSALSVIFRSGNYSYGSGFRAVYSSAFAACGGDFTAQSGRFTSPNYPDGYPVNAECYWNIRPSPGNRIQISFPHFELDPLGEINDDYVEIRSPNVSGAIAGRWIRNSAPGNLTSLFGAWVKFRSNEAVTASGFVAEYSTSYGGTLNGDSGQIASPQYPQFYPANSNYRWTVLVSEGMRIHVTFSDFTMEGENRGVCQYDYLAIFDGTQEDGVSLGTFCGSSQPDPLYSVTNKITVIFRSDRFYQERGFLMNWQAVTDTEVHGPSVSPTTPGCGGQLVATDVLQNITSLGYPDGYPNNMDCSWTISVPEGNIVVVNITSLYLEPDNECLTDYLRFHDGDTTDATVISTSCHVIPGMGVIRSRANILTIVFHTDSDNTGPGFVLSYEIGCGGFMQSPTGVIKSTGYPSNYPANLNCTWQVQVLPGKTIHVDFQDQFNIADSGECRHDYLLLMNGFSSQSPPLFLNGSTNTNGHYCGSSRPLRMETSSNFLFVNFISDESNQEIGFSLTYSTVSLTCGGELKLTATVPSGYFTSPNYPENYTHNHDCLWTMIAPANKRVQVDFEGTFSIQANTSCSQDYIEFHDGGTVNARRIGRPLCGTTLPGTVFSTGNVMLARFRTDSSATHAGFKAKYSIATCGGRITAANGIITSPRYPANYDNNLDCEWTITGPVGHFLRIKITDLRFQSSANCTADFLEIRDGNDTGRIMFKGCLLGSQLLQSHDTSDNVAFIRFRSDGFGTGFGFQLNFQISVEECGGELNTPTGEITSPNYPRQYPHTRLCTWDITVPEGRRVTLTFSDLRLQEASIDLCESDYVEVINGYLLDSPSLGKFCGETVPTQPVESSGNTLRVRFFTDGSVSNVGFKALYSSDREAVCGGDITEYPGSITSPGFNNYTYDPNIQCVWHFYSPGVNRTIWLRVSSMNFQYHLSCIHDFVEIREGVDINAPLVKKYCGASLNYENFLIPGNNAWVRFKTDASVSRAGFRLNYDVNECGGYLTDPQGVITSPNYPSNLADRKVGCSWVITAPDGARIKVNLTDDDDAAYDPGFRIQNGGLPDSPIFAAFNRQNLSIPYLFQSNQIRVVLQPYVYYQRSVRFRIEYSFETEGCGGLFHSNQGSLSSPNHPSRYPHNTECRWDINVWEGYVVSLHFNPPFDLEARNCTKDYVEVFDERSEGTLVSLGRWCHNVEPPDLRSTSTRMVVVFQSDESTNGNGFSARWDLACGAVLTKRYGEIRSPGFPNSYPNNFICDYFLSPGAGAYIGLYFHAFELEGGHGCHHDYIRVWEGNVSQGSTRNHTLVGTVCGNNRPESLLARTQMTIQFRTDGSGQFPGYLLFYHSQECNSVYSGQSGAIVSQTWSGRYFNNMNCTWSITVDPKKIIKLRFEYFYVQVSPQCQDDHVTVYNGPDTNSDVIGRYCGTDVRDVTTSTGNQMYITFITNHEGVSDGFFGYYMTSYGPAQGCGGVLRQSNGTITSLDVDGDGHYEENLDCEWLIYVNENKQVTLTVTDFNLQDTVNGRCRDSLRIYDGSTKYDVSLQQLCGSSVPNHTIVASSNVVLVVFKTDWRESYTGFNLTFGEIDVICGGAFNATNTPQTISSPHYPNARAIAVRCTWFIDSGDDNQHLRLHVRDLQLLETPGCAREYLNLKNEPRVSYIADPVYCGHVIPHSFESVGRKVKITYFLDTTSNGRGFQLTYEIADCNQNISLSSGRILSPRFPNYSPDNSNCTIQVTSPENTTLTLYFRYFSIESDPECKQDVLEIKNSSSAIVARLCGHSRQYPIFMTDNVATLRFQTDAENQSQGYQIMFLSSTQGPGCGGNMTGLLDGLFTSPGYPGSFLEPMTCTWYITPVTGRRLHWFLFSERATSGDCRNNYVSVYNGVRDTDTLFGRYCADKDNYPSHNTDNPVMVRYVSTGNSSGPVFRFLFSTILHTD